MFHLDHEYIFSFLKCALESQYKAIYFPVLFTRGEKHTKLVCFLDNSE